MIPLQAEEGPENVNFDPENADLREELRQLCAEFKDVLTDLSQSTVLDE